MRFYYITLTLFLQTVSLIAQPADAVKLSPQQIALIQNQGAAGIQTVFEELEIEIQDLPTVEAFALEVSSSQLTSILTSEMITDITSPVLIALAEIAISENIKVSYAIEYVSAGIAQGLAIACSKNSLDVLQSIATASEGIGVSAIQFSLDTDSDIEKVVSAVGSGYLAGTIEASNNIEINVVSAVEACSDGLIVGTINKTLKNNVEIYETLASTCEGIAEAAVEASVREQLDLIKQVTAASVGAGKSAVETADSLSLEIDSTKKAILKGLKRGIFDSIPGKGNNIRIMIAPQKDINPYELIKSIENGINSGGLDAGYIPIIETPFEDDPLVRQVSPI